jgi:hypothetical protein
MRWVWYKLRCEATTAVAHGKGDFAIGNAAFELHLAGFALLASVTYRVRDAFRQRQQDIVL